MTDAPAPPVQRELEIGVPRRGNVSLRHDVVLVAGPATDADRADQLAVDNQRKSARRRTQVREGQEHEIAVAERLGEHLGRPAIDRRGFRLDHGEIDRRVLHVIHLEEIDQRAGRFRNRDRHRPTVLARFGFRRGRYALRQFERDRHAVQGIGGGGAGGGTDGLSVDISRRSPRLPRTAVRPTRRARLRRYRTR